jgi:hypothetical protein
MGTWWEKEEFDENFLGTWWEQKDIDGLLMGTRGIWWELFGNLMGTKGIWLKLDGNKIILMGYWWWQEEFDENCLGFFPSPLMIQKGFDGILMGTRGTHKKKRKRNRNFKSQDLTWDLRKGRATWPHQHPEPLEIAQSLLLKNVYHNSCLLKLTHM